MDQGARWAAESAAGVGQRVRRYRGKMSARQLADKCAELGMPSLSRVVITRLENGRRESVSTSELVVLAAALDVPPVLLLYPLGLDDTVELLPGKSAAPWDAIEWFRGEPDYSDDMETGRKSLRGFNSPILLWSEHHRHAFEIDQCQVFIAHGGNPDEGAEENERLLAEARKTCELHGLSLLRTRQEMRVLGFHPPPLDPSIARAMPRTAPAGPALQSGPACPETAAGDA